MFFVFMLKEGVLDCEFRLGDGRLMKMLCFMAVDDIECDIGILSIEYQKVRIFLGDF